MSLITFLEDANHINKLILAKETNGYNIFESIQMLINEELLKEGITPEMIPSMDVEFYNSVLKSNLVLSFLHAINFNKSDDNKYMILKYNTRYSRYYKYSKYARSLVLNREIDNLKVISYGFEKFYNLGEKGIFPKDVDKELEENNYGYMVDKLDGTNITARNVDNEILINTTGSLSKDIEIYDGKEQLNHILEAHKFVSHSPNDELMIKENSDIAFIYEMVGLQQIVVDYSEELNGLHLIGARKFSDALGIESRLLTQDELKVIANKYNVRYVSSTKITKVSEALDLVNSPLYVGKEGVVVYVGDSIYKIKCDDYVLAHHLKMKKELKTNDDLKQFVKLITPLVVNESLDDYIGIYKGDIPEHVLIIAKEVENELDNFNIKVLNVIKSHSELSDKEFFKNLKSFNFPKEYNPYIGAIRKGLNYNSKLSDIFIGKIFNRLKDNI